MGNLLLHAIALLFCLISLLASHSHSLPLVARDRWTVDSGNGQRVKLHCANWPGHLGPMLAEGLDKQPIRKIVYQLPKLGLNCVRLTWATYMFTRFNNHTVQQTMDSLGLLQVKKGILENNPKLLKMTHLEAYGFVVDELAAANIMVISDNHISEPKWCCGADDGNAFFGDTNFDPKEWIQGLSMAAQLLKPKSNVVAMSLRNELRGPLQNLDGWYKNVTQGALTVHQANPNVIVIISGFYNDNDLSFLRTNPLNLTIEGKLMYEVHSYPVSGERKDWGKLSANVACGKVKQEIDNHAMFLTSGTNPSPLILSEFGIDLISKTESDMRWLTCIMAYVAASDLDWAWWGLQGSYYLREGQQNLGESYGLLTHQWQHLSFPEFPHKFQLLLKKLQEPSSKVGMSSILYHPASGQCLKRRKQEVEVSDCNKASGWSEDGVHIKLKGERGLDYCLKSNGEGKPVTLSTDCSNNTNNTSTSWKAISASGLHWATVDAQGNNLCLHKHYKSSTIFAIKCICANSDPACLDNPTMQWFQFVPTNV